MKRKYWYLFLGALVVGAAFCIQYLRLRPVEVQTENVLPHTFVKKIEFNGSVAADGTVIYAPIDGEVQNIYVQENETVQNRQPLVHLDAPSARTQLEQAALELEAQEKVYNSQRKEIEDRQQEIAMLSAQSGSLDIETFAQNVAPNPIEAAVKTQDTLDNNTLDEQLKGAQLKYQAAQEMISLSDIHSVMDGDIVKLYVKQNQQVSAGTPVCAVYDLDNSYLQAYISQEDSQWLKVSDEVSITGGMMGDQKIKGHIESFEHNLSTDPQLAGLICLKIRPEDSAPFQQLGASYTVNVEVQTKTAVSVPLTALAQDENGLYVLASRQGVARRIDVEIGMVDAGYVEVLTSSDELSNVIMNPSSIKVGRRIEAIGK